MCPHTLCWPYFTYVMVMYCIFHVGCGMFDWMCVVYFGMVDCICDMVVNVYCMCGMICYMCGRVWYGKCYV